MLQRDAVHVTRPTHREHIMMRRRTIVVFALAFIAVCQATAVGQDKVRRLAVKEYVDEID